MFKRFMKAAMPAAIFLAVAACGQSDLSKLEDDSAAGAGPVAGSAAADQKIKVVGSSTVAPFSRTIAERFGATTAFGTPIVESTGTGGGFKAFCGGVGPSEPSVSNASRPITDSERNLCVAAGVTSITEIPLGYDGIVVANAKEGLDYDLTKTELFLALAKDIPDGQGGFKPNPYKTWNEVAPNLPAKPILVLGPPPTSGTRDSFVELGMELGALEIPELAALKETDAEAFKNRAHTVRTDGAWVDFGENDTAIIQSLLKSPDAIGVLGFSFLEQNGDRVKGARLGGIDPTFENITSGQYGLARVMYFYVKDQNLPLVPGLAEFVVESVSDAAAGEDGYLIEKGLIPLHEAELGKAQEVAATLKTGATATP
ncbi:substrate-binding domain-containing protein [Hyphomonas sp.]|uniref:substrate-binding domain-containing protein n=1 Tax=Hyphomonas sp. TaxID=87 RepID=UPI00391C7C2F